MIEREEKYGVSDEKKKAFGVFIFYAKKKKIKMWKNDKKFKKEKYGFKNIQGKTSKRHKQSNLMVQHLRLEDRENHFWWVKEKALQYSLQNFPTI